MKSDLRKLLFNPFNIAASIVFGLILLALTVGAVFFSKAPEGPKPRTTADIYVIPGPTSTATSPPPTRTPAYTPTPTATATLPPGERGIGAFVMVEGTGGIGLNIRSQPGISGTINFLGAETEVFQIMDGPVSADGYTWWFIIKPGEELRQGWAAEDYFITIDTP